MGEHALLMETGVSCQAFAQLLIPALQRRAWHLPPLASSAQFRPGEAQLRSSYALSLLQSPAYREDGAARQAKRHAHRAAGLTGTLHHELSAQSGT